MDFESSPGITSSIVEAASRFAGPGASELEPSGSSASFQCVVDRTTELPSQSSADKIRKLGPPFVLSG